MILSATKDLLKAAEDNNTTPQVIENLIKAGADISAKDNEEKTALDYTGSNENADEIKRIILDAK